MPENSPNSRRLDGKVAIVTGGASGIGEATSRLFAAHGAKVIVADIQDSAGSAVAESINKAGGTATYARLDVSKEPEWQKVVASTVGRHGRLDILVNNAGMSGPRGRAHTADTLLENWELVMAVNSTGVFLGTKHAIPEMRKAGSGSIINISSIYGIVGSKGGAVYHASKGAVRTFTKAAAMQYAQDKIRVNSVHPGFVDSPMTEDLHGRPGVREERIAQTPLGRLGTPQDIALGNLYLASDDSAWVTGLELVIDGGFLAR